MPLCSVNTRTQTTHGSGTEGEGPHRPFSTSPPPRRVVARRTCVPMPSECAGALQKKKRTHVTAEAEGSAGNEKEPCSFVFGRGPVIRSVRELIHDTRTMMMPNTAKRMRVPPSRHTVHHCATLARLATDTLLGPPPPHPATVGARARRIEPTFAAACAGRGSHSTYCAASSIRHAQHTCNLVCCVDVRRARRSVNRTS